MCVFVSLEAEDNNWINNVERTSDVKDDNKEQTKRMPHQIKAEKSQIGGADHQLLLLLAHLFNVIALDGAVDSKSESLLAFCSTVLLL